MCRNLQEGIKMATISKGDQFREFRATSFQEVDQQLVDWLAEAPRNIKFFERGHVPGGKDEGYPAAPVREGMPRPVMPGGNPIFWISVIYRDEV